MNIKSIPKAYISYTILGFLYGILLWFQSIIFTNLQNNNFSNNIVGVNLAVSRSQIKALFISFFISIVYTIKDFYEYQK